MATGDRNHRELFDPEDLTEEYPFDELAMGLASGALSRRKALKLVGAALLGGLYLTAVIPDEAEAQNKKKKRTRFCKNTSGDPDFFLTDCCGRTSIIGGGSFNNPCGRGECRCRPPFVCVTNGARTACSTL